MKHLIVLLISTLSFLDLPVLGLTSKCATLYNYQSFYGNPYSLSNGTLEQQQRMKFVPNSVKVTAGCSLTIFDIYGTKLKLEKDQNDLRWKSYQYLDASCCQCGGCNEAADQLGSLCARLYENSKCDQCAGYRLEMKDGDQAKKFGPLDKKMTSVAVRKGCTLTVFTKPNFDEYRHNITSSIDTLGNNWYQQISSAKCACDGTPVYSVTPPTKPPTLITRPTIPVYPPWPNFRPLPEQIIMLPTAPTARPPMTLPTVPTTRPPMTLPTVPTTRLPMTLPTVPTTTTTRPPMTLPTVPTTTTTKAPITLPTISPSSEEEYNESEDEDDDDDWEKEAEDDFWGAEKSEEINPIKTTTTTTTTTTKRTTTTTTEAPQEASEEDDDWDW